MSSSSWEEIKRLAADFQRVQLVESSSKLSERNCIELINKLIELGMLNVYHSIDGKEFITHKHVEKEIYDELYVHEGRINIVKLQTLLNIDISYIETKANEIVKRDPNLVIILGQIISKDYMNKISEEINESLHEKGNISVSELTNYYELPADFIHQIIKPRVGTIIKGNYDGNMLYTHDYVNAQKAKLAGILEASIKPVRFSQIIKEYNLDASIIFEIFDDLINSEQIKGTLYGGRQALSAVYVPEFFIRAQKQYVESFLKQNGYVDYSSLKKIGITEPDSYVRSLFESQDIEYMSSSCFARYYLDNVEQEIDENLNRTGWCDLSQILPPALNSKDTNTLTINFEKRLKASTNLESLIMSETYLVSKSFIKNLDEKFAAEMEEKASEDLRKPNYVLAIKSENAVVGGGSTPASVGSGGKAKGKSKAKVATAVEDDNSVEIMFIDRPSLSKHLKSSISDANEDLIDSLTDYLLRPLNVQYLDLLKTKIEKGLISTGKNQEGDHQDSSVSSKPPSIKDVQEKVKVFLINARVFDRASKLFSDNKVQETISKHLIKTVYSDIINEMVRFIVFEQLQVLPPSNETLNNESRNKLIQKLKDPFKQRLTELNQGINTKTSSELIDLIEKAAVDTIELSVKKIDQKREKELILQMRENTKQSLESEKDPATVLHLTLTLLFQQSTGLILNSPGRSVPNILEHLRASIKPESFAKLIHFQNVIIENAGSKQKSNNEQDPIVDGEELNEIRSMGLNAKSHLQQNANI